MKIESSNVSLYNKSTFQLEQKRVVNAQFNYEEKQEDNDILQTSSINFSYSQSISIESSRAYYSYEDTMSLEDRLKKIIIERLLNMHFNEEKKILISPLEQINLPTQGRTSYNNNTKIQNADAIIFSAINHYEQKQTVDFKSSVQINTKNGTFELDLSISYTKELFETHMLNLKTGEEKRLDPLVINFDSDINPFENLSELKFEFDLNQDGNNELIPMLKKGVGYLALDKNNNGTIDDGAELFGTKSNDGFKDLKEYDFDKNNWIDENDEVFHKLKVWQKDDEENAKLLSLIDLNIGAIYLGDVKSDFKYQTEIKKTDAIQKSNGIFIKEDGLALGMINSIDIVI